MQSDREKFSEKPALRLAARLDIKGKNVIKGVNLEGLRIVGAPGVLASSYYKDGIDEIIFVDTVASLYGRNTIKEIIEDVAAGIHVPMTVSGGIRSISDAVAVLRVGADKVAINTGAVRDPSLITAVANELGRQCVVGQVDAKTTASGDYQVFTDNGREPSGVDVVSWCRRLEDLGAGEILLTSIDRDGTRSGFHIDLIERVRDAVSLPLIVSGGCGTPDHLGDVLNRADVDGIAVASVLHYNKYSIRELKSFIGASGFGVRPCP